MNRRDTEKLFSGSVDSDLIMGGSWLSRAWENFGGAPLQKAKLASSAFAELRHGETPEAFAMSWEAQNKDFDLDGKSVEEFIWSTPPRPLKSHYIEISEMMAEKDRIQWRLYGTYRYLAETTVIIRLMDGTLRAYGSKDNTAGEPIWIPPRAWQDLQRDRLYRDRVYADGITFYHVHLVDPMTVAKVSSTLSKAPSAAETPKINLNVNPKRGRRAQVLPKVVADMITQIESGTLSTKELEEMPEKVMEGRFGASRDTVRKARRAAAVTINDKFRQIAD